MVCTWCNSTSLAIVIVAASFLYYLWKFFQGTQYEKNYRIDGKVVIVTGCNTGIGKETALALADRGGKIYMACRDRSKCEDARLEIIEKTGNLNVYNRELNLNSLESIREFVKKFRKEESRLDILINNAGLVLSERHLTKDGYEMTFGVNHLGHFLLTHLLLDMLQASSPSRIINVSSMVHAWGKIDKNDIQGSRYYSQFKAYTQSKLANVLYTRELAKRLKGTGVVANAVHPGAVVTDIQRDQPKWVIFICFYLFRFFVKTTKSGAQTQIALAVDPELGAVSGKYFADCKVKQESKAAQDDAMAAWLWQHSEQLIALKK